MQISANKRACDNLENGEEAEDEANPDNRNTFLLSFQGVERAQLRQCAVRQELNKTERLHQRQFRLLHICLYIFQSFLLAALISLIYGWFQRIELLGSIVIWRLICFEPRLIAGVERRLLRVVSRGLLLVLLKILPFSDRFLVALWLLGAAVSVVGWMILVELPPLWAHGARTVHQLFCDLSCSAIWRRRALVHWILIVLARVHRAKLLPRIRRLRTFPFFDIPRHIINLELLLLYLIQWIVRIHPIECHRFFVIVNLKFFFLNW